MIYDKLQVNSFRSYKGNCTLSKALHRMSVKRVFPNKALIMGPYGSGKSSLATLIAKTAVCKKYESDEEICGTCAGCRTLFPNIRIINCYSLALKDSVIKDIQYFFMISGVRILILDEFHAWHKQQHRIQALLDSLSARNFLLMTSHRPEVLSPAFRSRCFEIQTKYISDVSMKSLLTSACRKIDLTLREREINEIVSKSKGNVREAFTCLEIFRADHQHIKPSFFSHKM